MALVTSIVLRAQNPTSVLKLAFALCIAVQLSPGGINLARSGLHASAPNSYRILTNYNDRDVAREQFIVTPQEGASDPLAPYDRLVRVQGGSFHFDQQPYRKLR